MRRVYLIWAGRLIANKFTAKIAALGILAWVLTMFVVVDSVVENASRLKGFDYATYYWNAFLSTGFVEEVILVTLTVVALLTTFETLKNVKNLTFSIFKQV